jgi:glucose/arabinose dehydrogenase
MDAEGASAPTQIFVTDSDDEARRQPGTLAFGTRRQPIRRFAVRIHHRLLRHRGSRGTKASSWSALVAGVFVTGFVASSCVVVSIPASLTVTTEVGGLNRPWDIAFTPDGTMLFTQKFGPVNAWVGGTVRTLAQPADVRVLGEGGMLGMAVDPAFATNRRIYTCFLSNISGSLDVRVVRWAVNADYTALTDRADIVTGMPVNPVQTGRHSGCRPRFGPDGNLWIATGDSAQGTVPQDPNSLGGKVLRVTTDGAGAPGNPGAPLRPEIYTYGHRNVQGLGFRPTDGKPYSVEHGTGCDDEVNVLEAGRNYGWDPVPGYNEATPMTDLTKFPDAKVAVWSSGCPTIAPSGAGFLSGSTWLAWSGSLAIAVLKGTQLRIMRFKADGSLYQQWTRITDHGRLRVAVQGPDGNLYLATDVGFVNGVASGRILKVVPSS